MDLNGLHIVITEPTAGIGRSSALSLAEDGAKLTLLCRNREKGEALAALMNPFFRSPDRGAETSLYLCRSDDVSKISGEYFANCKRAKTKQWVRDDVTAEKLWSITEQATGFTYPV